MKKRILALSVCVLLAISLFSGCDRIPMRVFGHKSRATIYVNNSDLSVGGSSIDISASDLTTSQRLVDTYIAILESSTVRDKVIADTGISEGYQVRIESKDETEIIEITVISWDSQTAYDVCYAYTQIAPERIQDIVEGASVKIVDLPKKS